MTELFPLDLKLGQLRGLILMLKERGGSTPLSELAKELMGNFADVFSAVESARMLGFITIIDGSIILTKTGESINAKDLSTAVGAAIKGIEPLKSIIEFLQKAGKAHTDELFDHLLKGGLIVQINRQADVSKFRRDILNLLVRTDVCSYNSDKDSWKLL